MQTAGSKAAGSRLHAARLQAAWLQTAGCWLQGIKRGHAQGASGSCKGAGSEQVARCKAACCKAAGSGLQAARALGWPRAACKAGALRLQAAGSGSRLHAARLQCCSLQVAGCKGSCVLQGCRLQGSRLQVAGCRGPSVGAHSSHSGRAREKAKMIYFCIVAAKSRHTSRAPACNKQTSDTFEKTTPKII